MRARGSAIAIAERARVTPRCTIASHEAMKLVPADWLAGTERLPHLPDTETVDGGLWYRNCRSCRSTLAVEVSE